MNPKEIRKDSFRPRIPRGGIFFDPRRAIEPIGPSPQDISRSNAVLGILGDQSGKALNPVTIGLGSTALVAGGALVAVTATHVVDIGSFPNIFNSSQDIEKVPPHLEQSPIFKKDAQKQIVWIGNSVQKEINEISPDIFGRLKEGILELPFPVDLSNTPNPQAAIEMVKTSYTVKFADGSVGFYDQYFLKLVNSDDSLNGALIVLPKEVDKCLTGESDLPNGKIGTLSDGVRINLQSPNDNRVFSVWVTGGHHVPSSSGVAYSNQPYVFESLTNDVPFLRPNNDCGRIQESEKPSLEPLLRIRQSPESPPIVIQIGMMYLGQPFLPPKIEWKTEEDQLIMPNTQNSLGHDMFP